MKLKIKRIREAKSLSQQEIADKINVPVRRYGSWEREERKLNFEDAILLAEVLGCTTDELAGRKPIRSYADPEQAALNGYYESMNADGRTALVSSARLMSGSPDVRIEKDGKEYPDLPSAMGA